MQNEVYPAIAEVVEFIERNIKIPINLDDIVAHVNISKYHLHRLFKALTGYSLIAYVRGRKLSLSLSELLQTNYSIIEIAYEYGFEYEQSYIRAFKAHYHITPNHVRKSQPTLEIVQKLDMKSMLSVARGLIYKPMFMVKPQFYLAGIECDINHADNFKNSTANKQALKFQRYIKHIDFAVNPNVYYGYVRYSDCPEIHNFYMPSIEVSQSNTTNPNLSVQTIPTSEYAVFKLLIEQSKTNKRMAKPFSYWFL